MTTVYKRWRYPRTIAGQGNRSVRPQVLAIL